MNKLDIYTIRTSGKKIHRREVMIKLSAVVAFIAILLLLVFYGIFTYAENFGNFTVRIVENSDKYILSLCEKGEFNKPTTLLNADVLDEMDNISERSIPEDVDLYDGPHNGENYIAYTFYVKNVGSKTINYSCAIEILSVTKNTDEAIRVRVYKNGVAVTYAKLQNDQLTPEPGTTPFYSNTMVMNQVNEEFESGDVDKYTIVIWLEGNDPECVDAIKGGHVRMVMNFNVIYE